jgi:hypothetical protein
MIDDDLIFSCTLTPDVFSIENTVGLTLTEKFYLTELLSNLSFRVVLQANMNTDQLRTVSINEETVINSKYKSFTIDSSNLSLKVIK